MMKKTLLICLIAASGICMNAQPVAKSKFIGGSLSMYYQSQKLDDYNETYKTTTISIIPKAGYFVTDRMAVGLQIGFTSSVNKTETEGDHYKDTETLFSIEPFIRYYLTSGAVGIFTEGSCNVGFGKTSQDMGDDITKGNIAQVMLGISPGIYYYVHPKLALEFSAGWLGYQYSMEEREGEKRKISRFGFDIETTGLSLGAIITL